MFSLYGIHLRRVSGGVLEGGGGGVGSVVVSGCDAENERAKIGVHRCEEARRVEDKSVSRDVKGVSRSVGCVDRAF